MPYNEEHTIHAIKKILRTISALRAPGGCPWDREQTHGSLRKYLIEETYETLEVLDQINTPDNLNDINLKKSFVDEWGDVLLQILLNAEIASETHPDITFEAMVSSLNEKMIRRHPHVFANTLVHNSDEVIKNWEEIKKAEKSAKAAGATGGKDSPKSVFDSISKGLPTFPRTMKVIEKVSKVGFQWPDVSGPIEKLEEEVAELKVALDPAASTAGGLTPEERLQKIESEIGDVLFSACNVSSFLKLDPEAALRSTLRKFESRFRFVEKKLSEQGQVPETSTLEIMDAYWDEAKLAERTQGSTI